MSDIQLAALVLAAIGPILALGRILPVPDTLVLFGAGLATTLVPGLPDARADPQLMLQLFLPPIVYAGTVRVSPHLLRFTLVSGVALGVAMAAATVLAATVAARLLLPGLPWPAALLLGAVAAIFDTRLFHEAAGRPHVPRAVADALKAREMAARVVAISAFGLALDWLADGGRHPGAPGALLGLAWELAGGAAAGVALGRAAVWLRERVEPAPVEIAVSVATPYLGALAAQALGLSVVVVVMAAALAVSAVRIDRRTGAPRASAESRISAASFWEEAGLILSAALFLLAGRALPEATRALGDWPLWRLGGTAAALLAVVVVVQLAFSLAAAGAPAAAEELGAPRRPAGKFAVAAVMTWASTRSVIGLVVALSIPGALPPDSRPFAERDLVLVVAALLIVGSTLLQGLTLKAVVRRAGLADPGGNEEEAEKGLARRARAEARAAAAEGAGEDGFDAERRALLGLRERNRIGDETLREQLRETDLGQRAGERSALPGAGPPNP